MVALVQVLDSLTLVVAANINPFLLWTNRGELSIMHWTLPCIKIKPNWMRKMRQKIESLSQRSDELLRIKKWQRQRRKKLQTNEQNAAIKSKIAKMEQQQAIKDKKIQKLQNKISELKKKLSSFSANFWEYEQIKQTWLRDFEEKIVGNIRNKGLQIGSRWKLQQQGNSFVIRDSVGSNAKDSRIAFPADTFLNIK